VLGRDEGLLAVLLTSSCGGRRSFRLLFDPEGNRGGPPSVRRRSNAASHCCRERSLLRGKKRR